MKLTHCSIWMGDSGVGCQFVDMGLLVTYFDNEGWIIECTCECTAYRLIEIIISKNRFIYNRSQITFLERESFLYDPYIISKYFPITCKVWLIKQSCKYDYMRNPKWKNTDKELGLINGWTEFCF